MSTPSGVQIIGLNTSTTTFMLNEAAIRDRGDLDWLPEGHECQCNLAVSGCDCLLVEAVFLISNRSHTGHGLVRDFVSGQVDDGSFVYNLRLFYQDNIEHIRAEFPDNTLSENADLRGLSLPVLERLIQMEHDARVGSQ